MKGIIFPPGTRRRRILDWTAESKVTIQNEGLAHFYEITKTKIRKNFFFPYVSREINLHRLITPRKFNVLFIVFPWSISNRYRVDNMQEYMKLAGIYSEIAAADEIESRGSWGLSFDIIVIHRIPLNRFLKKFIRKCRKLGIPVVFDLDDYIFDPNLIPWIEIIARAGKKERKDWIDHVRGCRQTLLACDYFLGTTEYLAERAGELGPKAFVIRNGFNGVQLEESQKALEGKIKDPGLIRLGFFSGTRTHQKDFKEIESVLLKILGQYPRVQLVIGGFLELGSNFQTFSKRVERLPYVDWRELPYKISNIDINLVPLEVDNPFNQAKSELKYFEAALLRIPTIASPTDSYQWAIRNGENGFLAGNEAEWYTALTRLIEDPGLRKRIGECAYQEVMKTYAPPSQAVKVKEVYQTLIMDYRKKRKVNKESLSISFLLPSKSVKDQKRIWEVIRGLLDYGHLIRLYTENPGQWAKGCPRFLNPPVEVVGCDQILCCDVLIFLTNHRVTIDTYLGKSFQFLFLQAEGDLGKEENGLCWPIPKSDEELRGLEAFLRQITFPFPKPPVSLN